MFYDDLFFIISVLSIPVLILILIYIPWDNIEYPWEEKSNDSDELYKQLTFKRQVEKAKQTYEELKAIIGKEEIDEIFNGYSSNDMVEVLNQIGNMMSLASCSMSEMADAFNAIATPSTETTETQEQKEPQVIFEPKVMIIEPQDQKPVKIAYDNIISIKQDDKEVNPFDDWFERFMEEVKLG